MKSQKQLLYLLLSAWLSLCLLTGCSPSVPPSASTPTSDTSISSPPSQSEPPQPEQTTPSPPPEQSTPPPKPEHSELYIPGLSVEDVVLYFNEVCLDAEYVNSGDPSRLQKWVSPILFMLYGQYSNEDLATLSAFTDWLNTIEGFPGISQTQDPNQATLSIHFCTQQDLLAIMGEQYSDLDGAVTFWYSDDEIYNAVICYRTDLDQFLRNSVILEELYNGLGPIQDTSLRPDSIIYADFSQPQALTEIDQLLLKLLYHPQMQCGMGSDECEAVIRQLYY